MIHCLHSYGKITSIDFEGQILESQGKEFEPLP
jgi:hypothetical protein